MLKSEEEVLKMTEPELISYLEWLHEAIGEDCFYSGSLPSDKTNKHVDFCNERLAFLKGEQK